MQGAHMSKLRSFVIGAAVLLAGVPAYAQGNQQQRALPEGNGKQIVQSVCSACHPISNIFGSAGYDEAGWRHLFGSMIALPENQARTVATYLAKNFPPDPSRRPTLVEGKWEVKFTEWIAPTLGQR